MPQFDPDDWISPKTASRLADVTDTWIRRLGYAGTIRTLKTDLGTLYLREDVEKLRQRRIEKGKIARA